MVKLLCVAVASVLAISLCGCGSDHVDESATTTSKPCPTRVVAPPTPPPPAPGPPVAPCVSDRFAGTLRYWEDGEAKDAFLIKAEEGQCDGPCVTTSDNGKTITFARRLDGTTTKVYLAKSCPTGKVASEDVLRWNMIGKTIRYTVDVSGLGCRCMAKIFLVGMRDASSSTCDWGYCDAMPMGQPGSMDGCMDNCQEVDLLQANREYAQLNTQASSEERTDAWGKTCPKTPVYNSYGPDQCIDSSANVHMMTAFVNDTSPKNISRIHSLWASSDYVTREQLVELASVQSETCNGTSALRDASQQMGREGMALVLLNAGERWLDDMSADSCSALDEDAVCGGGGFSISGIEIFKHAKPQPSTPPSNISDQSV